jgi:hypothetical protein
MNPDKSKKVIIMANCVIALTWFYHGIVPKLMFMETGELATVTASGLFKGFERATVYTIGVLEVVFGFVLLFFGKTRIVHYLNIAGLLVLATGAFFIRREIYLAPFNPATTSIGVIGLSMIVLSLTDKQS